MVLLFCIICLVIYLVYIVKNVKVVCLGVNIILRLWSVFREEVW